MGRGQPPADGPHRRPLSLGGEPDVRRDGRSAVQGTGRLSRGRAPGRSGRARRRLHRRPGRPQRRAGQDPLRPARRRGHPLVRLRPQRDVVAVVRPAQDLRRAARRPSLHREPRRARGRDPFRGLGRKRPGRARRRADPEDAGDRIRRHERGPRRSLRRHRRQALAGPHRPLRAPGRRRAPRPRRGHPPGQARQYAGAEAPGIARALHLYGRPGRRRRGDVLLGPGGPPPQLRHGRSRPQRVFRRARQARRHDRGPHGRDLQRL